MSLDKPMNLSDLPYIELDPNLLHQCLPLQKLKKSYDCTCKFQLEWVAKLPWVEESLLLMASYTMFDVRFVALLT
jgi:hypothetical protein